MYQNLCCGTLICPLSIWQLGLKLHCIFLWKSVTNDFPRSTDIPIIQVLNELPTDKRHIKVQPDLCPTHVGNKKKNRFSKKFFVSVLYDYTSVDSL